MAERKEADDEFNPRHRIVGAIILVALAVVFLPMLLSDRPPESNAPDMPDAPTPDTRIVVTPVPPLTPAGKPDTAAEPAAPDKPAPVTRVETVPVAPPPPPAPAKAEAPAIEPPKAEVPPPETRPVAEPKPAKTASKARTPAAKGWVVQVGVFSQIENARRLEDKLKHQGYPVLLVPPVPEKGKTVRVEVGPYKDAASAKTVQARLRSELGIQGMVRNAP